MLETLNKRIRTQDFWDADYLLHSDVDAILNMRDEKVFDAEWGRNYECVENENISMLTKRMIDSIRENVFMSIYDITQDGELAGYVSDDFDLMCKAYVLDVEDEWLAKLVNAYVKKRIPFGDLESTLLTFKDLFQKLALGE